MCILKGKFIFDSNYFIYESISKEYNIKYSEIEYIKKETYIDNTALLKRENYMYIIKIKNEGSLIFKYYNDSLLDAIEDLAIKCNLKIDE